MPSVLSKALRRRPPAALTLAVLVAALAVAGCGSSSSTTSSGASAATSSVATQTKTATTSGGSATTSSSPTTPSTSASAGTASLTTCRTPNLRLSMVSGQGAAGTAYITYGLTDAGTGSCTMLGYPGVAVLDAAGNIVQHAARRGTAGRAVPVRLITLAPGSRATFLVNSTDVIPSPGCTHAYTGVTLQVFPPNQRAALHLAYTGSFCDLRVGPVQHG
jgi:Protein of unknown function (DUF4232)